MRSASNCVFVHPGSLEGGRPWAAGQSDAPVPAAACGEQREVPDQRQPPGGRVGEGERCVPGVPKGEAPGGGCEGNEYGVVGA